MKWIILVSLIGFACSYELRALRNEFYITSDMFDNSNVSFTEEQCKGYETCMSLDSIKKFNLSFGHKIRVDCISKFLPDACSRRNLEFRHYKLPKEDRKEYRDCARKGFHELGCDGHRFRCANNYTKEEEIEILKTLNICVQKSLGLDSKRISNVANLQMVYLHGNTAINRNSCKLFESANQQIRSKVLEPPMGSEIQRTCNMNYGLFDTASEYFCHLKTLSDYKHKFGYLYKGKNVLPFCQHRYVRLEKVNQCLGFTIGEVTKMYTTIEELYEHHDSFVTSLKRENVSLALRS